MHSTPQRPISTYPWGALDRLPRQGLRALRALRSQVGNPQPQRWARALGELLQGDVELIAQDQQIAGPPGLGVDLGAEINRRVIDISGDGPNNMGGLVTAARDRALAEGVEINGLQLTLSSDHELAAEISARLLGRRPPLSHPTAPVDETLLGVLAAVTIEAARRAGWQAALSPAPTQLQGREGLVLLATLLVDDRAYRVGAWLPLTGAAPESSPAPKLSTLGPLPIAMPVVAAVLQLERAELRGLQVGDALLPAEGWLSATPAAHTGRALLAAPSAELGVEVEFSDAQRFVLRGESVALSVEVDEPMSDDNLQQAVLEAPVVVRVEVGSVSLSAKEWAQLRAGDVVETGQRVAEPVVLRVAGRPVARGELVEIEGELGVRILEIEHEGGEEA